MGSNPMFSARIFDDPGPQEARSSLRLSAARGFRRPSFLEAAFDGVLGACTRPPKHLIPGGVTEWSKVHDWKSCVPGTVPGVRIPSPPPLTRKSQQPNVQFGGFSGSEGKSGPKLGAFDFHLSIDAQRQDDSTPTRQTSCVSWSCQRWPVNSARPGREQRSRLPACGGAFLILGPAGADPRLTSSAPRSRYRCTARSAPAGALAARPRLNPDLGVGR